MGGTGAQSQTATNHSLSCCATICSYCIIPYLYHCIHYNFYHICNIVSYHIVSLYSIIFSKERDTTGCCLQHFQRHQSSYLYFSHLPIRFLTFSNQISLIFHSDFSHLPFRFLTSSNQISHILHSDFILKETHQPTLVIVRLLLNF